MAATVMVDSLHKSYGSHPALNDVSFEAHPGEVVGLIGPNGAGKTTLMRILVDLLRPSRGRVTVLGETPRRGSGKLRKRVGYLPGDLRFPTRGTAGEYLRYSARLSGYPDAALLALAEHLDIDIRRPIRELSKGNRQKVGLVQAFGHRPEVLILDEPTSGLDPLLQQEFVALVDQARGAGRTVLLSSHVLSEVEEVADRVLVLRKGELALDAPLSDLRDAVSSRAVVTFASQVPVDALFALPGAHDLEITGSTARLDIGTDPNALLHLLASHDVRTLDLRRPELSDVLLRLYGDDGHGRGVIEEES